ncbi:DUF2267 domain-containing protein [Streptomyces sp. ODS28]|uniref:DUF2267 domain-containing protein n=1 Tax=Streptomyces sp. ODS28 TaxID=3136688 RepID=UPI0031EF09BE
MDETLEALLAEVTERGGYPTPQEAARATQAVLETLGAHLADTDRTRLALFLPPLVAPLLLDAPAPDEGGPLTPERLLAALAARDGGRPETARRDADAVLGAVAARADEALIRRILEHLPPGHAPLFGRPEPR